jgi:hypothetical protein
VERELSLQLMVISSPCWMSLAAPMLTWRLSGMKRVYALPCVSRGPSTSQEQEGNARGTLLVLCGYGLTYFGLQAWLILCP